MKTNSLLQLLNQHKLVIPPIQRDYAQGRNSKKIPQIRERFLNAIVTVLTDESAPPLELDFIYGYLDTDTKTIFYPLDGQQRLTTLFLIHWYVAQKEHRQDEEKKLLKNFSYATRKSSRDFCEKLVTYTPNFNTSIDEEIVNQPWFFSTWKNDPTVNSMLVMLKAIEDTFRPLTNIWNKLAGDNPRLIFHQLAMGDLGLPDDLYIKMNARGKELTEFEHFKSKFSELLDNEHSKEFDVRIDKEWSDLFWNILKNIESNDIAKDVDNGFLNFFWYITHILCTQQDIQLEPVENWLTNIISAYKGKPDNIKFLFDCLNLFEKLQKGNSLYWNEIFYTEASDFDQSKVRLFYNNAQINLFEKCATNYFTADTFVLREQLLLYAFVIIKLKNKTVPPDFFRIARNHLEYAADGFLRNENLKELYQVMEKLIDGARSEEELRFSRRQLLEEQDKKDFIEKYPQLKEVLYQLEDHTLLRGNVALFDFNADLKIYGDLFQQIFVNGCDYFGISKAMLTLGNYTQTHGSKFRRFGNRNNSTWRELFTQSINRNGYSNTKSIVKQYLDIFINNPDTTNEIILRDYLDTFAIDANRPKDIIYYYLKYPNFSMWGENQTDGYYWWDDFDKKPYEGVMLFRTNYRGRHWSPFLLELSSRVKNCKLENYGHPLHFINGNVILIITNLNGGFRFLATDEPSVGYLQGLIKDGKLDADGTLSIQQNADGLDLEDRIEKCNTFLNSLIH